MERLWQTNKCKHLFKFLSVKGDISEMHVALLVCTELVHF